MADILDIANSPMSFRATVTTTPSLLALPVGVSTVSIYNATAGSVEVGAAAVVPTAGGAPGSMPLAGGAGSIPLLLEKGKMGVIGLVALTGTVDVIISLVYYAGSLAPANMLLPGPTPGFSLSLISSLVQEIGTGTPTFTRADATACATHTDFEGVVRVVPANCARFQGARLVRNLLSFTEDFTNAYWSVFTSGGATSSISGDKKTITFTVPTGGRAFLNQTIALSATSNYRLAATFVVTSGTPDVAADPVVIINAPGVVTLRTGRLTTDAKVGSGGATAVRVGYGIGTAVTNPCTFTVTLPQLEDATGQTNQNPSEYVPVGTGGPLYGSELVTPQDFSANWSVFNSATQSISAGVITATNGSFGGTATTLTSVVVGKTYVVNITLVGGTSPSIQSGVLGTSNKALSVGLNTFILTAVSNQVTLLLNSATAGVTGIFSNVSVREVLYSGAGVDGIQFFNTLNGNTVASNVVTAGTGAAIKQGTAGVSATAPVDASGPLGYLSEGSRTNLCLQSQAFGNASWALGSSSLGAFTTAPDGTNTMQLLIAQASLVTHQITNTAATLTAAAYTYTTYFKAGGYTKVGLRENLVSGAYASFDLTGNGTVLDFGTGATAATIKLVGNGVYRVSLIMTATAASYQFTTLVLPASYTVGTPAVAWTADGISGVYMWGYQWELGAFTSTYIPTAATAVTRAADQLTYPSAGNVSGTVGTAYAEITTATIAPLTFCTLSSFNGAIGGQILVITSGSLSLYDGTAYRVLVAGITQPITTVKKLSTAWSGSTSAGSTTGISGSSTFDGDLNLNAAFAVGSDTNSASVSYGTTRNVRIYPTALTSAQLVALTT